MARINKNVTVSNVLEPAKNIKCTAEVYKERIINRASK